MRNTYKTLVNIHRQFAMVIKHESDMHLQVGMEIIRGHGTSACVEVEI